MQTGYWTVRVMSDLQRAITDRPLIVIDTAVRYGAMGRILGAANAGAQNRQSAIAKNVLRIHRIYRNLRTSLATPVFA
jgi:hypothetical protein